MNKTLHDALITCLGAVQGDTWKSEQIEHELHRKEGNSKLLQRLQTKRVSVGSRAGNLQLWNRQSRPGSARLRNICYESDTHQLANLGVRNVEYTQIFLS